MNAAPTPSHLDWVSSLTPVGPRSPSSDVGATDLGCGRLSAAWEVLSQVLDPEVPAVSLVELGIVRDLVETADGVEVVLTPTYSGCPATEAIEQSVRNALARFGTVTVTMRRAPAWTTDWITDEGREKLRQYGIAPPGPVDMGQGVPIRIVRRREAIACPRCGSTHTEQLSAFGSTACKSLYRCVACREPFEHFKPI
jgi:ring-1,2-phenylacetyl-CoA epoxidase subunit PaaD